MQSDRELLEKEAKKYVNTLGKIPVRILFQRKSLFIAFVDSFHRIMLLNMDKQQFWKDTITQKALLSVLSTSQYQFLCEGKGGEFSETSGGNTEPSHNSGYLTGPTEKQKKLNSLLGDLPY
jgi:hypothetical protein